VWRCIIPEKEEYVKHKDFSGGKENLNGPAKAFEDA
jgi:hypothetical protein